MVFKNSKILFYWYMIILLSTSSPLFFYIFSSFISSFIFSSYFTFSSIIPMYVAFTPLFCNTTINILNAHFTHAIYFFLGKTFVICVTN